MYCPLQPNKSVPTGAATVVELISQVFGLEQIYTPQSTSIETWYFLGYPYLDVSNRLEESVNLSSESTIILREQGGSVGSRKGNLGIYFSHELACV